MKIFPRYLWLLFLDFLRHKKFLISLLFLNFFSFVAMFLVIGFGELIQERFRSESKLLLGADVELSARRLFSEGESQTMDEVMAPYVEKSGDQVVMLSNIGSVGSELFNVKWLSEGMPFYQKMKFAPGAKPWSSLHDERSLFFYIEAKDKYHLVQGQEVTLLGEKFKVAGFIEEDLAMSYRFLNFFPVVYGSKKFLSDKILKEAGNSFTYQRQYLLKNSFQKLYNEDFEKKLKANLDLSLPDPTLRISFPKDANEQNAQVFRSVSDYLGLVAFICFILSALGAAYQVRSYLQLRKRDWALMIMSGLKRRDWLTSVIFFLTLPTVLILPMALWTALTALSLLPQFFPIPYLSPWTLFGISQKSFLSSSFILVAFQLSIYCTAIFQIYGSSLYGSLFDREDETKKTKWWQGKLFLVISVALGFFVSVWLSRSLILSSILLGALVFISGFIFVLGQLILKWWQNKLTQKMNLPSGKSFSWYLAVRSLQYRRNLTLTFFSIFTIGVTLLLLLKILDFSFTKELETGGKDTGMFIFDIRPDQISMMKQLAQDFNITLEEFSPLIRGKIISLKGINMEREVEQELKTNKWIGAREREEEKRFRFRSINMTIRPKLSPYETIVEGVALPERVDSDLTKVAPVSLEKRYAQRLGLKVGDELSFDIQGVILKGRVVNLRSVKWLSLRPNFFITVPHGILDDAPMTYLTVSKKKDRDSENRFLEKLAIQAPSTAAVRLEGVLQQAQKISQLLIEALSLLGYFSLFIAFMVVSVLIRERLQSAKSEIHYLQLSGLTLKKIKLVFYAEILLLVGGSFLIAYPSTLIIGKAIANEAFDGILYVPWGQILWQAPVLATISLIIYRTIFYTTALKK
ncbi:MAG: hypothetical protein QE271_07565 [Bacteriovoracaceae bacterium]|nr:hypothetical protein [Bacteriovoracaceae bacterium]